MWGRWWWQAQTVLQDELLRKGRELEQREEAHRLRERTWQEERRLAEANNAARLEAVSWRKTPS
jgi:hypothetical protein